MSEINPEMTTILSLLKNHEFVIPEYQRSFAWNEKQINDLTADIENVLNLGCTKKHYISSLHLLKKKNEYEVIDGQQRLTIFFLLYKHFEMLSSSEGYLKLNNENDQIFFDKLCNRTVKENISNPETQAQTKLQNALELIKSWRPEIQNGFKQIEFTCFPIVITDSERTAFLTLNDRGKPLTNLEKLKALLHKYDFEKNNNNLIDRINGAYKNLFPAIDKIVKHDVFDENDVDDKILQYIGLNYYIMNTEMHWSCWWSPVQFYDEIDNLLRSGHMYDSDIITKEKRMNSINSGEERDNINEEIKLLRENKRNIFYGNTILNICNIIEDTARQIDNISCTLAGQYDKEPHLFNYEGTDKALLSHEYKRIFCVQSLSVLDRKTWVLLIKYGSISNSDLYQKVKYELKNSLLDIYVKNYNERVNYIKKYLDEMLIETSTDENNSCIKISKLIEDCIEECKREEIGNTNTIECEMSIVELAEKVDITIHSQHNWNSEYKNSFRNSFENYKSEEDILIEWSKWLCWSSFNFINNVLNGDNIGLYWTIMREYEAFKTGGKPFKGFDDSKQLEHMFPRNPNKENLKKICSDYGFANENYYVSFINRSGNLVFARKEDNQRWQNKDLDEKVEEYAKCEEPVQLKKIGLLLTEIDKIYYKKALEIRCAELALFALRRYCKLHPTIMRARNSVII